MRQNKENRLLDLLRRKEKLKPMVDFYEEPKIKEVFSRVEADIVIAIKQLPFDDYKGRDALFHELRCVEAVQRKINSLFNEMQIINHNIEVENGRNN